MRTLRVALVALVAFALPSVAAEKPLEKPAPKPALAPGFYHITFGISDMFMSRVVEIRNVRPDSENRPDQGYFDVTWVGMWPEDLMPTEARNRVRLTGAFTPRAIRFVIPEVRSAERIDVYYFNLDPTTLSEGSYTGAGDVPYAGPNGVGKNQFKCRCDPLPDFKLPAAK